MLVSIKSYNCTYASHILSLVFCLRFAKTREPKDEQLCIAVHRIINSICDTKPLDNLGNKAQIKWHCLT